MLYLNAQIRLFEVHKEQHSASREKYAPVVRTAARTHGRDTPVNFASVWGPNLHAFRCIQRLTSSLKKRTGTVGAGHVCMLPTDVFGPMYLCDNPALPYRSAQIRLFEVHKEQQGASREKYAPVVRTAARTHGRRHACQLCLCLGSNFAQFLRHYMYSTPEQLGNCNISSTATGYRGYSTVPGSIPKL